MASISTLTIKLKLDNAAFCDGRDNPAQGQEVARILRILADRLEHLDDVATHFLGGHPLYDVNGNVVGTVEGGAR